MVSLKQSLMRGILLALVLLSGCDRKSPRAAPGSRKAVYEVRGVLQRADAGRGVAIVAHEEIPGYMEAMTMEFVAAQPSELAALEPGDVLTFRLSVGETSSRIEQVRKVGHTTPPPPPAPALAGIPATGAPLPDVALVNDAGRKFRLTERKDTVLAITFIFTRCPLPDFCPRMNSHFATARAQLAGGGYRFLSVTIDPAHDTPERLAEFARPIRGESSHWEFATGEVAEIHRLMAFAGLETKGEGAGLSHNLRTLVVDADGKIARVFVGNDWQPAELVAAMKAAANY